MAMKVAERLTWAVDVLAIAPDDHLLEIGCGHGVAVDLICGKLAGGTITAIDRSAAMVQAARQRNRGWIAAGRAMVQEGALDMVNLGRQQFNKIFAVNVSAIWKNPTLHLAIIQKLLMPEGSLYLFYQPPYWKVNEENALANSISQLLQENGFGRPLVLIQELDPVAAVCVSAAVS